MAAPETTVQIVMPAMGESVTEGVVLSWLRQVGDAVAAGEPLVEVSTDKVDAEVPCPAAGVLARIVANPDETVEVGAVLGEIDAGSAPAGGPEDAGPPPRDIPDAVPAPAPGNSGGAGAAGGNGSEAVPTGGVREATPVAVRMAARHGLDLDQIEGTGPRGRVTKVDVEAAAAPAGGATAAAAPSAPAAPSVQAATSTSGGPSAPAAPADAPIVPQVTPIRGPAAALVRAMEESRGVPTATSFRTLEVDVLDERRRQLKAAGRRLSFTHLIAWAIVRAAKDLPVMTHAFAELEGKPQRVAPSGVSIGLAVDVERKDGTRGLVTPVIAAAEAIDFAAFVETYDDLVVRARDASLPPEAYRGAGITLTNPGAIGTVASVPRLMAGQGTIVATGAIGHPPGLSGVEGGRLAELGVAKVMTVTSTYDHRVIQGAESGAFLRRIEELLQGGDGFYEQAFGALGLEAPAGVPGRAAPARMPAGAAATVAPGSAPATPEPAPFPDAALLFAVQGATSVVKAHRTHGHLAAKLDPLGRPPRGDPALDPVSVGLTPPLMHRIPSSVLRVTVPGETFAEALPNLAETYTGTIAYEVEHISGHNRRVWLREAIEAGRHRTPLEAEEKRRLLERLSEVEALESYLHKAFLGKKQFSIEGLDALVPMLDEAIELSAASGGREVVLGMAHRGRLNVLAHTVGRPYQSILVEFEGEQKLSTDTAAPEGGTGDVKYHYGASGTYRTLTGKDVTVTLSPNPSHLEYVNAVIEGRARADQTSRKGREISHDPSLVVPILIHGDAAFPGQGIVSETLNLQALPGYTTGGTVHIIANNQLGFTTDPEESRSTRYASDLAKGFDIPIIHVNADDVEACIAAVRLAVAFRNEFGRDALIDLIGYRRFGHNETDEPAYTQPAIYEQIKRHPPVREVYAERLRTEGVVSEQDAAGRAQAAYARVSDAHAELKESIAGPPDTGQHEIDNTMSREPRTTLPEDLLRSLNDQIGRVPEGFTVHRKLRPFLEKRKGAVAGGATVDWAHAEALAFASLLALGVPLRLTGQDTERGTFSQRHLVLHDSSTGERWCPLQHLPSAVSPFELHNSPLSEQACLGFEYGYSVQDSDALVLWEAQFGDFVNSAQVIIDQFMVSGLAKWGQTSRLTLLLPHGYEGSGPEHSSGRVERFLQGCAEGNTRVANVTTPAQYFHLLRRQALVSTPRPLVVMTPKSLLRLPAAVSTLDELANGRFRKVIDDESFTPEQRPRSEVTKLVLCSGKVYYDISGHEQRPQAQHIAVARSELLYPFPEDELRDLLDSYPSLEQVTWVQEEPRNMGARAFIRRRIAAILPEHLHYSYVGRQLRAATGEGYAAAHRKEQARIVRVALDLEPDLLAPDASAERPQL